MRFWIAVVAGLLIGACSDDGGGGVDGGPSTDADERDDAGVRYPRLGLVCTTPDACGPGVECIDNRCTIPCENTAGCPSGAWCSQPQGQCFFSCQDDADCADRDVDKCSPAGACFQP